MLCGAELYREPVCPAALISRSQALVPAYCLPAPSPATPLPSLSLRVGGGRAGLTRVDQLPQLALLTFSPYLPYTPDCRYGGKHYKLLKAHRTAFEILFAIFKIL